MMLMKPSGNEKHSLETIFSIVNYGKPYVDSLDGKSKLILATINSRRPLKISPGAVENYTWVVFCHSIRVREGQ